MFSSNVYKPITSQDKLAAQQDRNSRAKFLAERIQTNIPCRSLMPGLLNLQLVELQIWLDF